MTRDAATVVAIFDRISRVAVASRSLRCFGSCALNLCRCSSQDRSHEPHHCATGCVSDVQSRTCKNMYAVRNRVKV